MKVVLALQWLASPLYSNTKKGDWNTLQIVSICLSMQDLVYFWAELGAFLGETSEKVTLYLGIN